MSPYEEYDEYEKYKEEIDWWDYILLPENRESWMKDAIDPNKRSIFFPPTLYDSINKLNLVGKAKVLDVGSGPLSPLAWGVDQNIIEVNAIDPLANIYKQMLMKLDIKYPIEPIQGRGETINEIFEKESFDVVYSRNALDHSDSPSLSLKNMVTLLKKGGILYLEGFVNEGSANKWEGLHQWNFSMQDGDLMCSAKTGEIINMTKELPVTSFFDYGPDNNRWFGMAFKKD